MSSWLPSIPYPSSGQHGFWEPVTSTLNWCEEDYYLTPYSAEIVNSSTNLLFMYLAFRGIRNCITQGHDFVFLVSFLGYLVVGTGSFFFHSTLKYPWQLVDELSMIYTTCIMFFASFSRNKSTAYGTVLGLTLFGLSAGITIYYHCAKDPVFHQVAYGLLTAALLIRSVWIMETGIRPRFRKQRARARSVKAEDRKNGDANGDALGKIKPQFPVESMDMHELERQDRRDEQIIKTMWTMIPWGLSIFLGGFLIWNLDNAYCSQLRVWRRQLGLPWGVLLEGHGWWHLMTGLGAYFYIVWGIWLRYCLNGEQDSVRLVWPSFLSIPELVKVQKPTRNGHASNGKAIANGVANGHANGIAMDVKQKI